MYLYTQLTTKLYIYKKTHQLKYAGLVEQFSAVIGSRVYFVHVSVKLNSEHTEQLLGNILNVTDFYFKLR